MPSKFFFKRDALTAGRAKNEAELKRLVESIAVGNGSPAIMAAFIAREALIREISNKPGGRAQLSGAGGPDCTVRAYQFSLSLAACYCRLRRPDLN